METYASIQACSSMPLFITQKLHILIYIHINMYMCSFKGMCNNFYCSSILNSQILGTTQRSIQDRMEKLIVAFSYRRVWVSYKNEQIISSPASTNRLLSQVQKSVCYLVPLCKFENEVNLISVIEVRKMVIFWDGVG